MGPKPGFPKKGILELRKWSFLVFLVSGSAEGGEVATPEGADGTMFTRPQSLPVAFTQGKCRTRGEKAT